MSGFNTKEVNNNGDYEITFYTENREDFKKVQSLCRELIGNGKLISTEGDLISRSEAEKLGATCLAKRNENGQLEAIISLENAPTVSLQDIYQEGHYDGHLEGYTKAINEERTQGDLISRSALKEDIVKLCRQINASNGITVPTLAFTRVIDNVPTVAVNCKDCDGYEAGYSAGLKDAERPHIIDNCDMNVFEPEKYMKGGAEE